MTATPMIDADRLWDSLMAMARIGATAKGGVCRLAASAEDGQARDLFADWCRELGMTIEIDRIGNMFARFAGADDALPPVMVGSHLDSQPTGGRFDGSFGVLSGLEIVRTLKASGIKTRAPLEIVNWTNEEGFRFQPSSLGAEVFAGGLSLDEALQRRDLEGKILGEELARIGYLGELPIGGRNTTAYLEGHIEQGPILEEEGKAIGVVEGAMGVNAFEVTLTGAEAHTGTTPVQRRRDALLGAARIIRAVRALAERYEPEGRATVAQMVEIVPNARSVVAGRVVLTSDCRHKDAQQLAEMTERLHAIFREAASECGLDVDTRGYWNIAPTRFDARCVAAVREAVEKLGYPSSAMFSGAGHDALPVARVVPAAMVFVPSKDGLSHNEAEYTAPEHIAAGANVLLHAALQLAGTV